VFSKPPTNLGITPLSRHAIYFPCLQQKDIKRLNPLTYVLSYRRSQIRILSIAIPLPKPHQYLTKARSFLSAATTMADRRVLVKTPPIDPSKSAIENVLELRELSAIAPVRTHSFNSPHPCLPMPTNLVHRTSSPTCDPSGIPQEHAVSTAAL